MLLQQLKYFVAVAETGSLSAAANRLFVTQPNLSKTIANLEDEYMTKLFNRTARGMSLTKEGNLLYKNAKLILKSIQDMEVAFGVVDPNSEKKLTIAAPNLSFADLLAVSYYRNYKSSGDSKCSVAIKNYTSEEIIENVANRNCEIGFLYVEQNQFSILHKLINKNDLECSEIDVTEIYANIGPLNPLYDSESAKIDSLTQFPLICHEEKEYIFHDNYSEPGYINLSRFNKVFYINSDFAKINFLRTTDAVYIGGIWSMMDVSEFGIKTIKVLECDAKFSLYWIKCKKMPLSEDAKNFIETVEKHCKDIKPIGGDRSAQQAAFKLRDFSFLSKN